MTTTETERKTATEIQTETKKAKDKSSRKMERERRSRQTVQIHVCRHVRLEAESKYGHYLIKTIRWGEKGGIVCVKLLAR